VFAANAMLRTKDPSTAKLNVYLNGSPDATPFARAAKMTVNTEIRAVSQVTEYTWTVDWTETLRDREGALIGVPMTMRAIIQIYVDRRRPIPKRLRFRETRSESGSAISPGKLYESNSFFSSDVRNLFIFGQVPSPSPASKFDSDLLGGSNPVLTDQEKAGVDITRAWRDKSLETMVGHAGDNASVEFGFGESLPSICLCDSPGDRYRIREG
jgi:VirB8 protein